MINIRMLYFDHVQHLIKEDILKLPKKTKEMKLSVRFNVLLMEAGYNLSHLKRFCIDLEGTSIEKIVYS